MAKRGILLFGGTFDPIHNGHLTISREAATQLAVEKTVLIPSALPPHKRDAVLTPAEHRLAMVQLAVRDEPSFEASDCELQRDGPSYTLDTVRHFRRHYGPEAHLYWLIGADSIGDLPGWHRVRELVEECTIVSAARPGFEINDWDNLKTTLDDRQIARLQEHVLNTPLIDIASREIRQSIHDDMTVETRVPVAVLDYITRHDLYKSGA